MQAAAARAKLEEEERAGKEAEADAKGKRVARETIPTRGWPAVVQRRATSSTVGGGGERFPAVAIVAERRASGHVHGRQAQRRGVKGVATASGNHLGVSRARKLFMNDRVDKVHEVAVNERARPKERSAGDAADGSELGVVEGLTGKSLNDMRREVQLEAAKGLNKWDRKALEAKRLQSLGAKAEKGIRTRHHRRRHVAREREAREQKRLEQFEAGGRLEKKKRGCARRTRWRRRERRPGTGVWRGEPVTTRADVTLSKKGAEGDHAPQHEDHLGGDRLAGGECGRKARAERRARGQGRERQAPIAKRADSKTSRWSDVFSR